MVKFNLKKKIAKALVFAMVMGTVGVHGLVGAPVAAVKAAAGDVTVTAEGTAKTIAQYKYLKVSAMVEGNDEASVEWTVTAVNENGDDVTENLKDGISFTEEKGLLVTNAVPKDTVITVKALYTTEEGTIKSDSVEVTVIPALIESVTVTTTGSEIEQDGELQFNATVEGDDTNSVEWKAEAEDAEGEKIEGINISATGLLTVLESVPKETTITVTATSKVDPTIVSSGKTINVVEKTGVTPPDTPEVPEGTVSIEVKYSDLTATLTTTGIDSYIFLEVLKENDKDSKVTATYSYAVKKETEVTPETPETPEGEEGEDGGEGGDGGGAEPVVQSDDENSVPVKGTVVVDLSSLKTAKADVYVRVYGNVTPRKDDAITTINKQPDKITVKYVGGKTGAASFSVKEGKGTLTELTEQTIKDYQFRSQFGETWLSWDEFKKVEYAVTGATIYVRKAAVTGAENKISPSNEVKVKIPAAPKAPKATIDYVKGTVSTPKKAEWSINGVDWDPITGDAKKSVEDVLKAFNIDENTESHTILFRTAADPTKKKNASNVYCLVIPAAPKLSAELPTATGAEVTVEGAPTKKVTLTYHKTEGKKVVTEIKAVGASFDVYDGSKWKTLTDGKSLKITEGTADQTNTIKVRLSGVKEKGEVKGSLQSLNEVFVKVPGAPKEDTAAN